MRGLDGGALETALSCFIDARYPCCSAGFANRKCGGSGTDDGSADALVGPLEKLVPLG